MCSLYVEFTALAASVMLEVINTADRHIVCVCVCERERERYIFLTKFKCNVYNGRLIGAHVCVCV